VFVEANKKLLTITKTLASLITELINGRKKFYDPGPMKRLLKWSDQYD